MLLKIVRAILVLTIMATSLIGSTTRSEMTECYRTYPLLKTQITNTTYSWEVTYYDN
jgi:hypothetical protein